MSYMAFRYYIWDFWKKCYNKKIPKDDDHFKLIVDTNSMGFRMWAMRNVDLVEVKKPLHLREEMKKIVKNAFEKYNT